MSITKDDLCDECNESRTASKVFTLNSLCGHCVEKIHRKLSELYSDEFIINWCTSRVNRAYKSVWYFQEPKFYEGDRYVQMIRYIENGYPRDILEMDLNLGTDKRIEQHLVNTLNGKIKHVVVTKFEK
jgi:hypothetical protein